MEEGQRRELRRWAEQLKAAEDREKRAAGRAIILLIEELDRRDPSGPPRRPAAGAPDEAPAGEDAGEERRPRERTRPRSRNTEKRRRGLARLTIATTLLGGIVYGGLAVGAILAAPTLHASGPSHGIRVGPAGLPTLSFSVGGSQATLDRTHWKLDGVDVTDRAYLESGRLTFDGSRLGDGDHRLSVSATGGFPGARTTKSWRFAIDTTGPAIKLAAPFGHVPAGSLLRLKGTLEPGATLTIGGRTVLVKDGRFSYTFRTRPLKPVLLAATDPLRNTSTKQVTVMYVPRRPSTPIRAVHVTFYAWADDTLRKGILDLIDQDRINTVELDLKDESGVIGFDANVPYGQKIGAVQDIYDLPAAVRLLHSKGVRVVGRLVCFRDAVQSKAAWLAGRRDEVIQSPDGQPYSGSYGGFTNFASPAVRRYEIAVAVAGAKAGVDDILYDYVRRPDGPLSTMVFPGLKGTPERSIAKFLAESRKALKPYKVFLGASVFGISATRPLEIAQDISQMAEHLDYVAPMVYPSHWGPGEYQIPNPNAQPYDIVRASLLDFQEKVRGTGARVVPWLQDFTLGIEYGDQEVADQIKAARDDGIDEFLLWDAAVTYHAGALAPNARKAKFTTRPVSSESTTAGGVKPNELGLVPVMMHHQILANDNSPYDLSPEEFRAEIERLYKDGFVPVRAIDYVNGTMNLPRGKSPVVMTFDDADNNQLGFLPDGSVDPKTAVGIMEAFARTHSDFKPTGTFYVPKNLFTGNGKPPAFTVRWLNQHGYEIANHTSDHLALNTLNPDQVQRELVLGNRLIRRILPEAGVRTMALPLGAMPTPSTLAVHGTWDGESYSFQGVFLAGAEPAPSPFAARFDPSAIPRIRTTHWSQWHGERDFTAGYWLDLLEKQPDIRYVSDGDPTKITFPKSLDGGLGERWRPRAIAY